MIRPPAAYVSPSGDVMVPPEIARILCRYAGLDGFRQRVRGRRPDLDALLEALRVAGERWAISDHGSEQAETPEAPAEWLSPKQVADRTGLTTRRITQLIGEERIEATWRDGRWLISRESFTHFTAGRRAGSRT